MSLIRDKQIEPSLINDYVLATISGVTQWTALSAVTGSVEYLNDLLDVTTNLPALSAQTFADDGRLLHYDVNTQQWVSDDIITHGTVTINAYGNTNIAKGTPVYLTGTFNNDLHQVGIADANNPSAMPVIGFAAEALTTSSAVSKHVITFGKLQGVNTTSGGTISGGESWTAGDILYISSTAGVLTKTRPVGATTQIQRIAQVLRVDASGGQLFIFNTARSAGLPNLTQNNVWVGNSNNQPVETGFTLNNLTDTNFTSLSNNQLLQYNSGSGNWVNVNPSAIGDGNGIYDGSGTVPSATTATLTDNITFDSGQFNISNNQSLGGANIVTASAIESTGSNGTNNALTLDASNASGRNNALNILSGDIRYTGTTSKIIWGSNDIGAGTILGMVNNFITDSSDKAVAYYANLNKDGATNTGYRALSTTGGTGFNVLGVHSEITTPDSLNNYAFYGETGALGTGTTDTTIFRGRFNGTLASTTQSGDHWGQYLDMRPTTLNGTYTNLVGSQIQLGDNSNTISELIGFKVTGLGTGASVSKVVGLDINFGANLGSATEKYAALFNNGNVGIGTTTPSASLDLVGTLQYVDGNQANNYVLTSDASGNATWQQIGSGSVSADTFVTNSYLTGTTLVFDRNDSVSAFTVDLSSLPDANGIYGGNGTVPSTTTATLTDNITFSGGQFNIIGGGDTSANVALTVENSSNTDLLNVLGDGQVYAYGRGHVTGVNANTGFGEGTFNVSTTGDRQVAIGKNALTNVTTGKENTAIGWVAGSSITVGNQNTLIGSANGDNITSGSSNTFVGFQVGDAMTTGTYNIGMGANTMRGVMTGTRNIGIGDLNGASLTSGSFNLLMGYRAGASVSTTSNNIFFGNTAGYLATGDANIGIGVYAGFRTTGNNNVGLGNYALGSVASLATTTNYNIAIGRETLYSLQTGGSNVAVGAFAQRQNQSGGTNTSIGYGAGYTNISGSGNVNVGYYAGYYETGSNTLFIDNQSRGSEAVSRTNSLIYGIFNATPANQRLTFNANVGIGVSAGTDTLRVDGTFRYVDGNEASGYVLTSDASGNATWQAAGADANFYTTGATLTGGTTLVFDRNDSLSAFTVDLSPLTFTGNTSGTCITDIYATNIYGCSPLHIEPSGLNDVYIVENGGNVGIGTATPLAKVHILGANESVALIVDADAATNALVVKEQAGSSFIGLGTNTKSFTEKVRVAGNLKVDSQIAIGGINSGTDAIRVDSTWASDVMLSRASSSLRISSGNIVSLYTGGSTIKFTQSGTDFATWVRSVDLIHTLVAPDATVGTPTRDVNINLNGTYWDGATSQTKIAAINHIVTASPAGTSQLDLSIGGNTRMVILDSGNVGIGTTAPSATLDLVGTLQYVDGNQASGYVLTSDASGNATWQAAPSGATDTNYYTTGATFTGNTTIVFDRNDTSNAYSVDISSLISGLTSKYAANVPMTGGTTETVTHSLGTTDITVQVKDSSGTLIIPDVVDNYQTNSVDINVSVTDTYRVIIIG